MRETPYESILRPIEEWCKKNGYFDFLVTILLDGNETTQVLEFDGDMADFVWLNDWWEGEKDVKLLGFSPIGDIRLHNYPCEPMTNYDSLIRKTPEEMAKWLGDKDTCPPECWKYLYDDVDCAECWLAWMKQEASE